MSEEEIATQPNTPELEVDNFISDHYLKRFWADDHDYGIEDLFTIGTELPRPSDQEIMDVDLKWQQLGLFSVLLLTSLTSLQVSGCAPYPSTYESMWLSALSLTAVNAEWLEE